jgi:predicted component of type VI protein secretion system
MAYLTIEIDQKLVAAKELTDTVVVGRSPDCDLHVPSKFLSRRHLRIERLSEGWRAVDLESTNGSTVDGQQIAAHSLDDGDEICVENVKLIFRNPPAANELSRDASPDRIATDEIPDIEDAGDHDSVYELPEEPTVELQVEQVIPAVKETLTPQSAPAPKATPARQERSRDLWDMAISPELTAAAQAALRPPEEKEQASSGSFWEKLQTHPRFKPVAIGLAASVALFVCYLSFHNSFSSPHYDVRPLTETPTHSPGHPSFADSSV